MKTIFALYDTFENADAAAAELLVRDFKPAEINAIVQTQIAKDAMDVDMDRVKVRKTDEVGDTTVSGLTQIISGQQAVELDQVGVVYAVGDMATTLVRTAAAPGAVTGGVSAAFESFAVPEQAAQTYADGLRKGDVLLWLHVSDERASDASAVLRQYHGRHIESFNK